MTNIKDSFENVSENKMHKGQMQQRKVKNQLRQDDKAIGS